MDSCSSTRFDDRVFFCRSARAVGVSLGCEYDRGAAHYGRDDPTHALGGPPMLGVARVSVGGGSRLHFAGMSGRGNCCYASDMDTPRHISAGLVPVCRCSGAAFHTSLNVARDSSAGDDAFVDLGLLIGVSARD